MWTTLGAGVRGLRRLVPRGLRPLPRLHLAVRGGLLGRGPPAPGGFGAGGSPSFMNAIHQVHLQSLLSEAEATGAPLPEGCLLFSSFFCRCCRARGGVESSAITAKWNGKSSASSFSTCDAYNNNTGREHQARHVLPDGTCRYKHACDKSRTRGLLANTFRLTLALLALTPTAAMPSSSDGGGLWFAAVEELRSRVFATNACDCIPGCKRISCPACGLRSPRGSYRMLTECSCRMGSCGASSWESTGPDDWSPLVLQLRPRWGAPAWRRPPPRGSTRARRSRWARSATA